MLIPLCTDDYNQYMDGFGTADELTGYDTLPTSFRIWRPVLFRVFDVMVTDAYFTS